MGLSENIVHKILGKGTKKDRYSRNMAITPEKFEQKFKKFERGPNPSGAKFMNIVDELDDQQLSSINTALRQKREADEVLQPYGLHHGQPQESWVNWRTTSIEDERKAGLRKEKNPRR